MPQPAEQTLTAADARLDACMSLHSAFSASMERLGSLGVPSAETALDDIEDLIAIVRQKLLRAWTEIDAVLEPIRKAREDAEHEAWIVTQEAANDDAPALDIA